MKKVQQRENEWRDVYLGVILMIIVILIKMM